MVFIYSDVRQYSADSLGKVGNGKQGVIDALIYSMKNDQNRYDCFFHLQFSFFKFLLVFICSDVRQSAMKSIGNCLENVATIKHEVFDLFISYLRNQDG